MSFLTYIEQDASIVETAVVDGLKAGLDYVDNVLVTEIGPELLVALKGALNAFSQEALAEMISGLTPSPIPSSPDTTQTS